MESMTRANNSNGTGTVVQVNPASKLKTTKTIIKKIIQFFQIANNPTDSNLVVLVGNQLFRMLACSENSWRQFGFCKADQINITCAAWLTQDRLLAGTIDGRIMALENGDIKAIYTATEFMVLNFKVNPTILKLFF